VERLSEADLRKLVLTEYRRESDFRRDVIRVARAFGWSIHADPDLRERLPGTPGFPDLVLAREWTTTTIHGKQFAEDTGTTLLFRELKRNGQYLSPEQDDWRLLLKGAGQDYDIWRPLDWPRIAQELT
jgi:hypothetical protein